MKRILCDTTDYNEKNYVSDSSEESERLRKEREVIMLSRWEKIERNTIMTVVIFAALYIAGHVIYAIGRGTW